MARKFKDLLEVRATLKPTLLLLRHGETDLNDKRTNGGEQIRGWLNPPLNAQGKKEAVKIAEAVADFPVKRIYSSDLRRAAATANVVWEKTRPGVPVTLLRMLRPWNLGKYQGQLYSHVKLEVDRYMIQRTADPVPGGESFNTYKHRWLTALKALLAEAGEDPKGGFIAVVTHARNLRVAVAWVMAGMDREELDKDVMTSDEHIAGTGGGIILARRGERWTIRQLNGKGAGSASHGS